MLAILSPLALVALTGCSRGGADGSGSDGGADLSVLEHGPDMGPSPDAAVGRDMALRDLSALPPGSVGWTKHFPVNQTDYQIVAVAMDGSGDVVLVGSFQGTVDFGGGPLPSAGKQDAFVVKFDATGRHLFSKRYGGPDNDWASGVVTGPSDVVVVTGAFAGSVDFGTGPLNSAGSTDIFLVKLDAAGGPMWSKRFGDIGQDDSRSVAMGKDGSLAIAGRAFGPIDFGAGAHGSSGFGGYVANLTDSGGPHFSVGVISDALNASYSVAIDGSGDTVMGGFFNLDADFGGGTRRTSGFGDLAAYVVKYGGKNGSFAWDRVFHQSSGNYANNITTSVAADSTGGLAYAGQFNETTDFGLGSLSSMGRSADAFVVRAGADGKAVAARRFGGSDNDTAQSVALAAGGDLVLAGQFRLTADFGSGPQTSAGSDDAFVARYDSSFTPRWVHRFGGAKSDIAFSVAVGPDGSVACAGTFQDTVDFGNGPVTAVGEHDIFLLKLAP